MTAPYTAQIDITQLTAGTVQATDVYPAVDVTDLTQSTTGTTKKYTIGQLFTFILNGMGIITYQPCDAASTANLNAIYNNGVLGAGATLTNAGVQAAFTLDGTTGVQFNRYLITDQTDQTQNGIYILTVVGSASTNWILTRAPDCNTAANIIDDATVFVEQGNTYAGTLWRLTFSGICVVGTTLLVWSEFSITPSVVFTWNTITGTTATIHAANGYIPTNTGLTTFTLPTVSNIGDVFIIKGFGSGGWKVAQNAGQQILLGNDATTNGVTGFIASTNQYDNIEATYITTNIWSITSIGNITLN